MRPGIVVSLVTAAALAIPASAAARFLHIVTPGESLTSIAAHDGLSIPALAAANHLRPDARLVAGSALRIPDGGSAGSSHSTRSGTVRQLEPAVERRYTVRPGDTLSAIAARSGLSLGALAAANHLHRNGVLLAGTVLTIRGPSPAPRLTTTALRYTVRPGDTLSAIAARSGLSLGALAAANHLQRNGVLLAGAVLTIPGGVSPPPRPTTTVLRYTVRRGDTLSAIAARSGLSLGGLAAANHLHRNGVLLAGTVLTIPGVPSTSSKPSSSGAAPSAGVLRSYVVAPGDTLSAIAVRSGLSLGALAAVNHLQRNGVLFAGSVLEVPGDPAGSGPPYPTPERVTASQIEQVAVANGVPASLAAAIGWQESGFNNDLVSNADARGVMQILPGTWSWIVHELNTGPALAPASAIDNVRGGVLLLHSLLAASANDPKLAAAGYIQGLASIAQNGMYPETRQYVDAVMALRARFGGP